MALLTRLDNTCLKRSGSSNTSIVGFRRIELQLQSEILLSGQPIENPHHRGHDFTRINPFRAQAQAAGLNAGNIEDVPDQFQQVLRRVVGHINGRDDPGAVIDALERQFEHADDGIHRGANLMTHGCQKRTFGPVGFIGTFFGTTQVIEQLPPFAGCRSSHQ